MKWPTTLKDESEHEAYVYFDRNIRPLPKRSDGSINTMHAGFHDNDVDAFRHAYVSGIFTLEYSDKTALLLGWMNELAMPSSTADRNMDLWNNAVGRELAHKHKDKGALAEAVKDALIAGKLIIQLSDSRVFNGASNLRPDRDTSVIVLKESESGANEFFFDFNDSKTMTRAEFVTAITAGQYPGYTTRTINGVEFPASKRDGSGKNNLG